MKRLLTLAATVALTLAGSVLSATPAAAAANVPPGCASPQEVNSKGVFRPNGNRIGTLTQYWGWCNSEKRNWSYLTINKANSGGNFSILETEIQTQAGGRKGNNWNVAGDWHVVSDPTNTMAQSTRAWADVRIYNTAGDEMYHVNAVTAYTG